MVMITASTPSLKASSRPVSDSAWLSGPLVSPNIIGHQRAGTLVSRCLGRPAPRPFGLHISCRLPCPTDTVLPHSPAASTAARQVLVIRRLAWNPPVAGEGGGPRAGHS